MQDLLIEIDRGGNMKVYEYMVVYSIQNGNGRCSITRDKKIKSYDDIEVLDKVVRDLNGMETSFVTYFKLLRTYRVKNTKEIKKCL
jgi:hypothetical protein